MPRVYTHRTRTAHRLAGPADARRAFCVARANADRRGIEWCLTFDEWWGWWQEDGRWQRRGRGLGLLQMARRRDQGAYALDNIYPAVIEKNRRDACWKMRTPLGVFDNRHDAGVAHGVKAKTASDYATKRLHGFEYLREKA